MRNLYDIQVLEKESTVDVKHTDLNKSDILLMYVEYIEASIEDYYDKYGKKYEPFLVIDENLHLKND
ncbi:hypothetical protein B8A44_08085 [Dolosigranulum pigrum]|uniref:Uncharacterized protein n=1 Tax=Dolosigranulum pigrum TaxID=29394 RepID=A0A328KK68_9LACT|nr:hypothetical protein [Dolosigranulum pigrum]RAN62221.1 hypothetical protein B8A44_08085 [Dolosigranulum pigrum]